MEQTRPFIPPHSMEAEKSVLGSMLISRSAVEQAVEALTAQDFYLPKHQDIFAAMAAIYVGGGAVDSVTLLAALQQAGTLEALGGAPYITELSLFVPSAANVSHYIHIVSERSVLRQLMEAGATIAREADSVLYTWAGPEIAVATTKAYSTQLALVYLIGLYCARALETIRAADYDAIVEELLLIPTKLEAILENREDIQYFASLYFNHPSIFFIGRNIDYAVGLEGSLKLKEISYIHSEAYAAGELKHGTISLIEDGTLVIGVLTQSQLYEKTLSNMAECKSRGAYLMGLTSYGKYDIEDAVNFAVYVPRTDEHFSASLAVIPLQLLGYYVSVAKGLDVDKPRNLAKSVTVE